MLILKWRYEPEEGDVIISNVANDGRFACAINTYSEGHKNARLLLVDSNAKILWESDYPKLEVTSLQLSEDEKLLIAEFGFFVGEKALVSYDEQGEVKWTYKGSHEYILSRDGKYAIITKADQVLLLEDGKVKWRKSPGGKVAVSPNNSYIVSAKPDVDHVNIRFYTIDGTGLKILEFVSADENIPGIDGVEVSNTGDVLLVLKLGNSMGKVVFMRNDMFLWTKGFDPRGLRAKFSQNGDSFIVSDINGLRMFNKDGKLLWNYQGYVVDFDFSDDYITLTDGRALIFLSYDGKVLLKRIIEGGDIKVIRVSPNGNYIAIKTWFPNRVYLFEYQGSLIKKRIVDGLNELLRR